MKKLFVSAAALIALSMGLSSLPSLAQAAAVTLFNSKAFVAATTQEDHFSENMELKPGEENLPLTLVVKNGGAGKRGFNWFRVNIGGYLMASEQDLRGRTEAAIDVTGRMQPGGGQILIDAAGEPGATLSFALISEPISLRSLQPANVEPGQSLVLHGSGFSSQESQNAVYIGTTAAQILSASPTSITVLVPHSQQQGNTTVKVVVNSLETPAFPLQVSSYPAPVLASINYWIAPPGAQLIITGKNFSPKAADNKVYFGTVAAQVISATSTSLTAIVPNWSFGPQQLGIALGVESNGVRSSNTLNFNFGAKYQGAWPTMPGDSSSESR